MPEPWPDFADAADAAPVFWNDHGTLWFFFGSPRLLGAVPFQFMRSRDNGATWSAVEFPNLQGPVGKFTPQPINSVVRARDGTIYLPVDGAGGESVLFASSDEGKTWRDTGGRTAGRHTTLVLGKDGSLIGFGGKNTDLDGFMPKAISRDGGKTYEKSKTPFQPLGSGQRPSVIRLASGRLFFVADLFDKKKLGPKGAGAFVALSDDDGETWKTRQLPGFTTVGYTTATQAPGRRHPHRDLEKCAGLPHRVERGMGTLKEGARVSIAPRGHLRVFAHIARTIQAGNSRPNGARAMRGGRYLLDGRQVFYYENGRKQWEATFRAGARTGLEIWWGESGEKQWERAYSADGSWDWKVFDEARPHRRRIEVEGQRPDRGLSLNAARAAFFQKSVDFGGADAAEIAGDGMFQAARRYGEIERFLARGQFQQAIDQTGREGIAAADAIDDMRDVVLRG